MAEADPHTPVHFRTRNGHLTQAWPISIFHCFGHSDWFRDVSTTQAEPMRFNYRLYIRFTGKEMLLSARRIAVRITEVWSCRGP